MNLLLELKNAGLVVDRVIGNSDEFYCRLMHGVVNNSKSSRILKFNRREIRWEVGEHLLPKFCRNLYLNILTTLKKVFANVHLT
ncbi:uncharacterized protein [Arachis hypogaea]|uniref:uncharacterized protein isoform X4 n=1 Tax=Arachis hypogaea TaxID=3818 RepID=UPI003B20D278